MHMNTQTCLFVSTKMDNSFHIPCTILGWLIFARNSYCEKCLTQLQLRCEWYCVTMLPLNNYQIVAEMLPLQFNADWIGGLMKVINTLNEPITWK